MRDMRTLLILLCLIAVPSFAQLEKSSIKQLVKELRTSFEEEDFGTIIEMTDTVSMDYLQHNDLLVYRLIGFYYSEQLFKAKELGDIYQIREVNTKEKVGIDSLLLNIQDYTTKYNFIVKNLYQKDSIDVLIEEFHDAEIHFNETYYLEGLVASHRGNNDEAIEALKHHLDGSNDDKTAKFISSLYESKKDYIEALAYINKGIEIDSNNNSLYFDRARIYTFHNNFEAAWEDINRVDNDSDDLKYWRGFIVVKGILKTHYKDVESDLIDLTLSEEVSDKIFKESNKLLFDLYYEQKRYINAYHKLTTLIRIDIRERAYYHERRTMLFDLDLLNRPQSELLLLDLETLLKIDPTNESYQLKQTKVLGFYSDLRRVTISEIENRIQERTASFDDFKVICEYYAYQDTNKAKTYAQQAQYKFRKATREDPEKRDFRRLAQAYELNSTLGLKPSDYTNYVKYISEAILLDEEDLGLKYQRAKRYIKLEQYDFALEDLIAMESNKGIISNIDYIKERALCYIKTSNVTLARQWIEKGLALNPHDRMLNKLKDAK